MNAADPDFASVGARWSTLTGGVPPARHHLAEGWVFGEEAALPTEIAHEESLLIVAMLAGRMEWRRPDGEATELPAGCVAGFFGEPGTRLARKGGEAGHLLLWRFRRGTVRAGLEALGLPQPSAALCWPLAPRPFTGAMQSLLLELRAEPSHGTARAWWYGAKLIELVALLLPASAQPAPATREGGVREPVRRALVFMQRSFAEPISLADVARAAGLSPTHLSRVFSEEAGMPLRRYLRRLRMERAAQLLRSGQCNVTEAAMEVGYASIGQFSRAFRETHGQSPGALMPTDGRKKE